MAKRNYKVYTQVGISRNILERLLAVLDPGAGPNFIRDSDLPHGVTRLRYGPLPNVADANNNPIRMKGLAHLLVRLGSRLVKLEFIVCDRLAAPLILGCDFMDRFVEAIYPRKKTVEMDDGTTVPITRKPLRRPPVASPVAPQDGKQPHGRESSKIRVAIAIVLPPEAQTWISVVSKRHGLAVVQPQDELYLREKIIASNAVVQVEPERTFRILMANLSKKPKSLAKGQIVGTFLPDPTAILNTPVTLGQVLKLNEVDKPVEGEKNEALSETDKEKPEKGEEKSKTIKDVDLEYVGLRYQKRVREMLRKYAHMWDGSLSEISTTEHRIDLTPEAKPVGSAPYRVGPKARKAESKEFERMLRAGVIEPAQSEWASPVVLVPKPNGTLRFCVDYRRLNAITVRDTYPLPRMDECIDFLGEANVFTTLDCNSGYWRIRGFSRLSIVIQVTGKYEGTYRYKRMPFGLTNAPETF